MSNIKKKKGDAWKVIASNKATGISVDNPKIIGKDPITSVDAVLEKHNEDISLLKRNVAWLALHGGGGAGGGTGPGGGDITEATCDITVNNIATGGQVMVDKNGITISLNNISVQATKLWRLVVRVGATQVLQGTASFTNPTVSIPLERLSPYMVNHTGNLYVGASYEDDVNNLYGSSNWNGTIIENVVNIESPNYSFNIEALSNAQINYKYSVGFIGDYTLSIDVLKGGAIFTQKSYPINIGSTITQTKTISLDELFNLSSVPNPDTLVGVYNVQATLSMTKDSKIQGVSKNTITIISDRILVATTKMSTDKSNPTEVSVGGTINVSFTAFLQGMSTYTYKYLIDNTLVKDSTNGYFGQEVNDFIPTINKPWAVEGKIVTLTVDISSGDKMKKENFYIKFVKASSTFLSMDKLAQSYMISEFLSRNFENGLNTFNLSNPNYINGGVTYDVTSILKTFNSNSISVLTLLNNGLPYLRLSNGAYARLGEWNYGNRNYTLNNILVNKEFTISICFKADYHPDDYRTILYCGSVNVEDGSIIEGISIDVHDVYINSSSRVKLTDKTVNVVDITCIETKTKTPTPSGIVERLGYIVKVYLDGVLTAVSNETKFPNLGEFIYLGSRVYNQPQPSGGSKEIADYLCDCNIYNLQIYDHALSDLDIVINYINNIVSTNYRNNQPAFDMIPELLRTNFCERLADGTVKSYMFDKTTKQYSIDFLLDGNNNLSEENLNAYAKVLGIPIMLVDVAEDPSWTFNAFVTLQTAGNVSLGATSGRRIQYWDPDGDNTRILNINNVTIELQGTSTLADAVKNLNITVPNLTAFIPKSTWFPEQTYTLKADVVDSSHSNNASIGTFINEVLGYLEVDGSSFHPFDNNAVNNVYKSDYKLKQQKTVTLKHTVEGFPVFLIMKFHTDVDSKVSTTPLGIYSFNLGRDAYRNLGFRKLNSIKDSIGIINEITTFPYLLEDATFDEVDTNANWIEIKDTTSIEQLEDFTNKLPIDFNSAKGDFWQNDDSILNARYEVRFPAGKQPAEYPTFKTFVGNIMQLPIEGTYSTDVLGKLTIPQVTDPYELYTVDSKNNYLPTGKKITIKTDPNDLPLDLGFNVESVYKYSCIGLLFGLIDNFGKNSTWRSWGGQYYEDFYDLDSALGGGNQGQLDITPDVWFKFLANNTVVGKQYGYVGETFNKLKAESGTVVSANHNKLLMSIDTPLFRAWNNNIGVNSAYTQHWYKLRKFLEDTYLKDGYKDFADYFIDKFYIKQTKNCGPLLFNYDYKLKYLLQFTGDVFNNTKDLTKLHGRKIAYARDWLKKHIQFMDSLFYWRDSTQTITFKNDFNSRGANVVYNTPDAFPIKANAPFIMYHSVGNTTQTFYFMQRNKEVFVNAGNNSSNSALNWNFSNSPSIIQLGNKEVPLSSMNISILSATPNDSNLNTIGYPSITELNLAGNKLFGDGFSLKSFEEGPISELRTLNFRNTQGKSFRLDLNFTSSTGQILTKYEKLTSIDISESQCISGIDIPQIPLTDLKIFKSSITALELKSQKYLGNIDLTGCNRLQTIYIAECDAYTDFSIEGLQNLSRVDILNCPNITNISIKNCPNLRIISIEGNSKLTNVAINGCHSLVGDNVNFLTFNNCTSLEYLDLSDNRQLSLFNITNSNQANITKLYLDNTNISHINGDGALTTMLDLEAFTKLNDFTIFQDKAVTHIQLSNVKGSPIPISNSFQGCDNLERIYGNILFRNGSYAGNAGSFRGCRKFSIHGNDLNWKGNAIKVGGIIRTPWSIISGGDSTNANDIYGTKTLDDIYVAGRNVTNIQFVPVGGLFNSTFRGTNISQFDIYYILTAFALSVKDAKAKGISFPNQGISFGFYDLVTPPFDWNEGNHPDRFMFYGCSNLTSFGNAFSSKSTFLLSPELNKDNGLFSPLINVIDLSNIFGGALTFSKDLFKRYDGKVYPLTSFTWNSVFLITDTDEDFSLYSNINNEAWLTSNIGRTGNFNGFFDGIPNVTSVSYSFNLVLTLNYDSLVLPVGITHLANCLNAINGKGTINLTKIFPAGSKCSEISGSFRVQASTKYSSAGFTGTEFPITSNMFENIKNTIAIVGYNPNNTGSSIRACSFNGTGLRKYIAQDIFPENIVAGCPKLRTFAGFFEEVENKNFASIPRIPGNMFLNNPELTDVSSLMYNANFAFTLSGEGFKNCPYLSNVAYFCYHDTSVDASKRSKIQGEIPFRLFYHGHSEVTKEIKGTNQVAKPDKDFDLNTLLTQNIRINRYNTNIRNMYACFYGCVGITAYTNAAGKVITEPNENYAPFNWIYEPTTGGWIEGTDKLTQDNSWGYTGVPSSKVGGIKYLEGNVTVVHSNTIPNKIETLNYCCSPDLFRYCTNSGDINITNIFENCGLNYSVNANGYMSSNENYYSTGILGRIPPYLLKPINNITDISKMFKNCRRLSSYSFNGNVYQIPKDFFLYAPKVNKLVQTFQGLSILYGTSLDVFSNLHSSLDIRCMLSSMVYGASVPEGSSMTIGNIFANNQINKISGVFSSKDLIIDDNTIFGVKLSEYRDIGVPSYIKAQNNFAIGKVPPVNAINYVYYGWDTQAADDAIPRDKNNYM